MKKAILTLGLILLCHFIFAQKIWLVSNPKGFDFYLTTTIEDGVITGMTRDDALIDIVGRFKYTLARMTTTIEYPEIIHFETDIKGGSFNGKIQKLFDQLDFNGVINGNSLKIITYKDDKTKVYKGTQVAKIIAIRNYKKTINSIIQLTEKDVRNQKYIKSSDWSDFKYEILEISDRIKDDFELEIAFGGIARGLPDELIDRIKENTKALLNFK